MLVATQSPHAADVLAGLLARYPGPTPVLFGDAEQPEPAWPRPWPPASSPGPRTASSARTARVRSTPAAVRAKSRRLAAALDDRAAGDRTLSRWQPLLAELAADVPGAFRRRPTWPGAGAAWGVRPRC